MVEIFSITHSVTSSASPATQLMRQLHSDYLQSVCSRNAFHPYLDVVACGNSSGRVHIFR